MAFSRSSFLLMACASHRANDGKRALHRARHVKRFAIRVGIELHGGIVPSDFPAVFAPSPYPSIWNMICALAFGEPSVRGGESKDIAGPHRAYFLPTSMFRASNARR